MRIALGLMFLAGVPQSCDPASIEAAGLVPGDGGVWMSGAEGGVFIDSTSDLPHGEALPELPSMETLCMLVPGDWNERNDYERRQGTWINDITDERLLGAPAPNAKYVASDSAQLRYSYRKPGTADEKVSISMGFERLLVVDAVGAELFGDGTAIKGNPWPDPWFLNRIEAQGLDEQPLCWDPFLRWSTQYRWTPCDWCKNIRADFIDCKNEDPKQCFY